jgi:hypothetical protein
MKKGFKASLIFLLIIFSAGISFAQLTVTPIKGGKGMESAGMYYALPRNYIKVDFIIERNQRYKGPYADYASRTLGVDDYVKQDETRFTILDVIISRYTEPDPNAYYFVEFDDRSTRDLRSLVFSLQPDGIILAADDADQHFDLPSTHIEKTLVNAPETKRFNYFAERNLYQRIDTIVRRITIDTTVIRRNILQSSWVDRNPEQKARAAADHIHKIRESRYNLISGYQEINYGQSIVYMDQQLLELENEYLSLFIGKEVRTIEEQSFLFLPEKGKSGLQNLVRFSETLGFVETADRGENINIRIEPAGNTDLISQDNRNVGSSKLNNSLYYRIPEYVEASVVYKGRVWAKDRFPISQMGVLSIAPLTRTRMVLDPHTGGIKTLKRD